MTDQEYNELMLGVLTRRVAAAMALLDAIERCSKDVVAPPVTPDAARTMGVTCEHLATAFEKLGLSWPDNDEDDPCGGEDEESDGEPQLARIAPRGTP